MAKKFNIASLCRVEQSVSLHITLLDCRLGKATQGYADKLSLNLRTKLSDSASLAFLVAAPRKPLLFCVLCRVLCITASAFISNLPFSSRTMRILHRSFLHFLIFNRFLKFILDISYRSFYIQNQAPVAEKCAWFVRRDWIRYLTSNYNSGTPYTRSSALLWHICPTDL